jgi:tetratricopeptide (TPR) repeat protein
VRFEPITTATDIYSLGVLLYELLTGQRPYRIRSGSPLEIVQAICQQEPAKPSTAISRPEISRAGGAQPPAPIAPEAISAARNSEPRKLRRQLEGDLDNIVLKAMQKEPQRRYGSVDQFSEDIRRHLAGLPVIARKDTFSYRAAKFARRNRGAVAAAALVFVVLAAGAATTLWQARLAVEQRERAERRFNDVRRLANSFLFEFNDAIVNLPGSTPARSLVVKRALEYLDSLASEGRGDRSLQMEIASAYQRVGEVQGDPMHPNLGDSQGALASSRKSLAIREALSRAEPENHQVWLELAVIHDQISHILVFSGDLTGAVEHSGKALEIYETLAGNRATDPKFQAELAIHTYNHANLVRRMGDIDSSLAGYTRAAQLSRRLIATNPSDPTGKIHLATSLDGVGGVLQEKGNTTGALENRRQALTIREELAAADSDNPHYRRQLAFAHHNVGLSLMEAGDLRQALKHFRHELSLFESLRAADPKDAQARRNPSLAHKQIGDVLMRTADLKGALDQYRKALEIDRSLSAADPANTQTVLDLSFSEGKFGFVLGKLGKTQEALAILGKGVLAQESLVNKDPNNDLLHGYLANSYTRLAHCLAQGHDTKAAIEYYRKALESRLHLYAKNAGNMVNRGALAECYTNLGKAVAPDHRPEVLEDYSKAIELLESLAATDVNNAQYRIRLADAMTNEARLYARMASETNEALSIKLEQWHKARYLYQRSWELWSELEREGKLPTGDRQWPREVARELAGSENSLAKLQNPM